MHLWARRKSGTSNLYIADLVLMPVDECFTRLSFERHVTASYEPFEVYYDESRYLSRGRSEIISYLRTFEYNTPGKIPEINGPGLWLEPDVDNRLYFLLVGTDLSASGSPISADPGAAIRQFTSITMGGNLIPRSLGLREG